MKKVSILGERKAALIDTPDLVPYDDWAVVKIHTAPMCTEYKNFISGENPQVMGHEAAGEVVEVANPGAVMVGDRVAVMPLAGCGQCPLCRSGDYIYCDQAFALSGFASPREGMDTMAEYILKPAWLLPRIPDDVSYEAASLTCCGLGPSFGAFQAMALRAGETVLITGAGPVGLGAVINAVFRGARPIVIESIPYRVERALTLGAYKVIDPRDPDALAQIMAETNGLGVDAALDCSGNAQAERICVDALRKRGRAAFIGECYDPLQIKISPDMIRKGITLMGSWHYNRNDFPAVMNVVRHAPGVKELISHRFAFADIQQAFEQSASQQTGKVILQIIEG